MRKYQYIFPVITLAIFGGISFADARAKPAGKNAQTAREEQTLQAEVISVKGQAEYRNPDDAKSKYTSLQQGDTLDELAVIRMGLGAKLELQFSDRVKLTASGGGKFGLRSLRQRGDVVTADVGLKYGALRLKVDSAAGPNDFRVTTPVATLSARGCNCFVSYFPDKGLNFANTHDTWVVATPRGKKSTTQGDKTNQNLDSTHEVVSKELDTHPSDPLALGNVENTNLRNHGGGRGVMDFGGAGNGGINTGGVVTPVCPSPTPSPKPPCPGISPGGMNLQYDTGP